MHVDGVAGVGRELSQCPLAPPHALRQPATGPRAPEGERAVVCVPDHQGMGAGDVTRGGRDVSWRRGENVNERPIEREGVTVHPISSRISLKCAHKNEPSEIANYTNI